MVIMFTLCLVSFFLSFFINLWILKTKPLFSADETRGVQKFHSGFVPRLGGLGIFMAFTISLLYLFFTTSDKSYLYLIFASIPVFLGGLLEDITKRISPKKRLILASLSAFLSVLLLGVYIYKLDIPLIDRLLGIMPLGVLFTVFAIAGVSNAYNIIDGFNGLASAVAMVVFTSFAYMGLIKGDAFLLSVSLVMLFATLGFFVLNYPYGKIFLGDGGAYFIGFIVGFLSVYLVFKYRDVSPWYPLVLSMYPVFETLFSIYRKKFLKNLSPFEPDGLHLHMLVYKRITKTFALKNSFFRNSAVMPLLVVPYLPFVVIANLFWYKTSILMALSAVYVIIYLFVYRSIVYFKLKAWTGVILKRLNER